MRSLSPQTTAIYADKTCQDRWTKDLEEGEEEEEGDEEEEGSEENEDSDEEEDDDDDDEDDDEESGSDEESISEIKTRYIRSTSGYVEV